LAGCGINGAECLVSTNGNLVAFEEERADIPDQLVFKIYLLDITYYMLCFMLQAAPLQSR
jgi:hypothetical protein